MFSEISRANILAAAILASSFGASLSAPIVKGTYTLQGGLNAAFSVAPCDNVCLKSIGVAGSGTKYNIQGVNADGCTCVTLPVTYSETTGISASGPLYKAAAGQTAAREWTVTGTFTPGTVTGVYVPAGTTPAASTSTSSRSSTTSSTTTPTVAPSLKRRADPTYDSIKLMLSAGSDKINATYLKSSTATTVEAPTSSAHGLAVSFALLSAGIVAGLAGVF